MTSCAKCTHCEGSKRGIGGESILCRLRRSGWIKPRFNCHLFYDEEADVSKEQTENILVEEWILEAQIKSAAVSLVKDVGSENATIIILKVLEKLTRELNEKGIS